MLPDLVCIAHRFAARHWDGKRPLLIGLSGGPDSKALLHAFLSVPTLQLHIAHVDHGWRSESRDEAQQLAQEAEMLGIPFHTVRLENVHGEAAAREARLDFFRDLQCKLGCQAVLVGHQRDDLAETVLKRIFEGASLPFLGGMEERSDLLWRPFLSISRAVIEQWLHMRKIPFFRDPSNGDPKYLRARMRSDLLPLLEKSFGKSVRENLCLLSKRSHELKHYLALKTESAWQKAVCGPFGWMLEGEGLERLERRFILQRLAAEERFTWTDDALERALDWNVTDRSLSIADRSCFIDRGRFFLLERQLPKWRTEVGEGVASADWRAVWKGEAAAVLEEGCFLQMPTSPLGRRREAWREAGVPAFLRLLVPAIYKNDCLVGDFFLNSPSREGRIVKISFGKE